jgi:3-hydroxybutyrate dehydrogenase
VTGRVPPQRGSQNEVQSVKQIPEQARELHITEQQVIKTVMLNETVDGEFTTTDDVADAVLFFAGASANALTGQSLVVSHGWFMQ